MLWVADSSKQVSQGQALAASDIGLHHGDKHEEATKMGRERKNPQIEE